MHLEDGWLYVAAPRARDECVLGPACCGLARSCCMRRALAPAVRAGLAAAAQMDARRRTYLLPLRLLRLPRKLGSALLHPGLELGQRVRGGGAGWGRQAWGGSVHVWAGEKPMQQMGAWQSIRAQQWLVA